MAQLVHLNCTFDASSFGGISGNSAGVLKRLAFFIAKHVEAVNVARVSA